jgi:hypothetical protein
MARNLLPPGARRLPQRPVPPGLRHPSLGEGETSLVDIYRLFALPASMQRAAAFLGKHAPAGMKSGGTGSASGPGGVTEMDVYYFLNRPPSGISSAELGDMIVPAPHGGALLRVDVQVIWYPPRSAAEYLAAKDYRAVQIDAWVYGSSVRHLRRTFASRGVLGKLTRLLNGLPGSPAGVFPCPMARHLYPDIRGGGRPSEGRRHHQRLHGRHDLGGRRRPARARGSRPASHAGRQDHARPSHAGAVPPAAGATDHAAGCPVSAAERAVGQAFLMAGRGAGQNLLGGPARACGLVRTH